MKTTLNQALGRLRGVALATVLTASVSTLATAQDQDLSKWYLSVNVGASISANTPVFTNNITTIETEFNTGTRFGGAIGFRWNPEKSNGMSPRTELEINYSKNSADRLNFSGNGPGDETLAGDSQVSSIGILVSQYVDFRTQGRKMTPYLGAGLGFSRVDFDLLYNAPGLNLSDKDTAFAWHITGGASFALTNNASTFFDVGYHQTKNAGSLRRIGGRLLTGAGGGRFEDSLSTVVLRTGITVGF